MTSECGSSRRAVAVLLGLLIPTVWGFTAPRINFPLSSVSSSPRNGRTLSSSTEASSSSSLQSEGEMARQQDELEEKDFLSRCRVLCDQRNLPLEKVKNARDLASIDQSPVVPGRLFRAGRMSDATDKDVQLLFDELNITTLIDLRSPTELKDDATLMRDAVYGNFTSILWREMGRKKDGCVSELEPGQSPIKRRFWNRLADRMKKNGKDEVDELEALNDDEAMIVDCDTCTDPAELGSVREGRKERHFVSVMNELKYVKGTVSKVRKRDLTKSLLKSPGALVSRRVRHSAKKPFLDEINGGGLPMVNDMLLRYGAPGIKYVLELCADTTRHPVAFYCTAGKDRTGVVTAIILRLCGVPTSSIVEDYTLSANVYAEMNDHKAMVGALSQRSLDPKTFLGAPAHVMQDTLDALEEEYGSVEEYCTLIGFGPEQQQQLRDACMN